MTQTPIRYDLVDILRGIAISMMLVFHFCFELVEFGFATFDFYASSIWLNLRTIIVSTFLLLVGVSLYLSTRYTLNKKAYAKRLMLLAACAGLVTLSTYLVKPERIVFFGILHFISIAGVVGLLFTRLYWLNLILGFGLILVGQFVKYPIFDQSALQWFGLMTYKPITADYVPLLPWFGVVVLGIFIGRFFFNNTIFLFLSRWQSEDQYTRRLAWMGRKSLPIYMLHIPAFIVLLSLVSWVTGL